MLESLWRSIRLLVRDEDGLVSIEYKLLLGMLVAGAIAVVARLCLATCQFSSHTVQALP
jgi:Flp pilus assembly pilin Flp